MPKVEKQVGEDPDPTPYLFVSLEQKRIDQTKPYDAKKACWVPDEKEGYVLGEIKATKGDLVTVGIPGGEVRTTTNTTIPHSPKGCTQTPWDSYIQHFLLPFYENCRMETSTTSISLFFCYLEMV